MQNPTLASSPSRKIHLIGGKKGGVGKSRVSRLLDRIGLGAKVTAIKYLHDPVVQKIDAHNSSFLGRQACARWPQPGHRGVPQRLKMWLSHAYSELNKAGA